MSIKPKRTKEQFLSRWEEYVNELTRLGNSTESMETWNEIKRMRENMRRLVHKVADELYS